MSTLPHAILAVVGMANSRCCGAGRESCTGGGEVKDRSVGRWDNRELLGVEYPTLFVDYEEWPALFKCRLSEDLERLCINL